MPESLEKCSRRDRLMLGATDEPTGERGSGETAEEVLTAN